MSSKENPVRLSESTWLTQLKRLHAIAESGLAFSPEPFDVERYQEISLIVRQMLANITQLPIEPVNSLITPYHRRYVTPQVEVRGALFHENKVLLVREKSDGKWTLPGGYADVGLTPVENICKEVQEEANVIVDNCSLVSIRRKGSGPYDADIREFYKLIFLCHCTGDIEPKGGHETDEAEFFSLNDLPILSTGRTIVRDIFDAKTCLDDTNTPVIVD